MIDSQKEKAVCEYSQPRAENDDPDNDFRIQFRRFTQQNAVGQEEEGAHQDPADPNVLGPRLQVDAAATVLQLQAHFRRRENRSHGIYILQKN